MTSKKIAIIGLGGISRTHLHHLKHSPELELAGGVDLSLSQRESFAAEQQSPAYANLSDLLSEHSVDGIIVATPPSAREEIILTALDLKIGVLSEKPLAADATTAERLATHPNANQLLRVGYCHRWTGATQTALKMIQAGDLGDLVWMNICFSGWMPQMESHWMTAPSISGGGALVDNGCHALDLFAYLTGGLQSVSGAIRQSWSTRGEDSFAITALSNTGALGLLQGSYLSSAPRNEWEICGTKSTLRYSYEDNEGVLVCITQEGNKTIEVEAPHLRFPRQLHEWWKDLNNKPTSMATAGEGAEINRWLEGILSSQPVSVV